MKNGGTLYFSSLLTLTAALVASHALAAELQVYPGCAAPPAPLSGHIFYVDPVNGSASGDGSQTKPFNSLEAIFASTTSYAANPNWLQPDCKTLAPTSGLYSRCLAGPLLTSVPYYHWEPKGWVTSTNPNAPINPGDTILLMSGNYGNVTIDGAQNPEFITITAAPNQTPVFSNISVNNSSKLLIQNLKFQALADGYNAFFLVGESHGPSSDIIFDSNSLSSQEDVSAWTLADWLQNARFEAIKIDEYDHPACVTLSNNKISNVRTGIGASASNSLVTNNTINNFGDDALDYDANNLIISHNTITNSNTLGDSNHNDCMQGQIGRAASYSNILIDSNTCIGQTDANLKFPGSFQGIDTFDNDWYNVTVTNNLIIVPDWQGLSYSSLHGGLIANNTVLAQNPAIGTWITVGNVTHEGSPSNDVIVRNNISTTFSIGATSPTVTADHNLAGQQISLFDQKTQKEDYYSAKYYSGKIIGDNNFMDAYALLDVFEAYDPATYTYNLKLKGPAFNGTTGDPAVGTGNSVDMPTLDITGATRTLPASLGAYNYLAAVNGSCGADAGMTLQSPPTGSLCTVGTASTVTASANSWSWSCSGINGGAAVSCAANKEVINGACGASNAASLSGIPTTGLCATGTASKVTGTGPWLWSCLPQTAGGSSVSCKANPTYNGTVKITANARQDGTPQLIVKVDGKVVGTATVTADVHTGQVGNYIFNFAQPTHPTKLELTLNGYTSSVQKNVSVAVFNVDFGVTGTRGTDVLRTGQGSVENGNIALVTDGTANFETNGSTLQFNVTKD